MTAPPSQKFTLAQRYAIDPRWRTQDTLGLAQGILEDGAFDRFPLLGDALMDAGCDNNEVLGAVRTEVLTAQSYLVLQYLKVGTWQKNTKDWEWVIPKGVGLNLTFELLTNLGKWVIPKGVSLKLVFDLLTKLGRKEGFTTFTSLDLDEVENLVRPPNQAYHLKTKATQESTEGSNQSATQLWNQKFLGMTLQERLLLEILYFAHTGNHLDQKTWDRTLGSRRRDGFVPGVYWDTGDRGVAVRWHHPAYAQGSWCARSVVSVL
jgi:hypothetical protein